MSLSVIPLTILGQITGVTGSGETALYQVSFKSIDGTPLFGVTAVWTDEQAEIEALAAQKPYGVWINPIDGTFTVKFAGYTYVGSADLTDQDVLAGITPIEFANQSGGGGSGLPDVTAEDNGKMLQVEDAKWSIVNYPIKSENSATLCDDTVTLTNEDVDVPFEAGADISNPSSWTVKINGIEIPKKTSKAFEYSDYENETIYGVSLIGDTWKVYVTDLQDATIPGDYSVKITSKSVILDENFVKALAVFFNLPNERMGNGTMTINVSVNAETGKPSYSFTWTGGLG